MDPITMMAAAKIGGSVFGAIQAARGKAKMKEADKMAPDEADPNRLAALEDAKRKTRQLESGTDTTTQQAIKSADQSTTSTQKQLAGVTGGGVGSTVSAMLGALQAGGNIKNQAFGKAGERGLAMGAVANKIGKDISQRALDIKQFKSVQRRAEGADALKTGMGNLTAGLFGSVPTDGGGAAGNMGAISQLLQYKGAGAAGAETAVPQKRKLLGADFQNDNAGMTAATKVSPAASTNPNNASVSGFLTEPFDAITYK